MAKNRIKEIQQHRTHYIIIRESGSEAYKPTRASARRMVRYLSRNSHLFIEHQSFNMGYGLVRRWFPAWRKGEVYQIELQGFHVRGTSRYCVNVFVIWNKTRRYGQHYHNISKASCERLLQVTEAIPGYDYYESPGGGYEKHTWYIT